MLKASLLLVPFLLACASAQYDWSVPLGYNVTFAWTVDGAGGVINGQLTLTGINAWVGVGLSQVLENAIYGMGYGDFIVCNFPNNTVLDYHRDGSTEGLPCLDPVCSTPGTNDVKSAQTSRVGTTSTCSFSRALVTGDANDWPIGNGPQNILFAHGTSDTFGYHSSYRGYGTLDFYTGVWVPAQ